MNRLDQESSPYLRQHADNPVARHLQALRLGERTGPHDVALIVGPSGRPAD